MRGFGFIGAFAFLVLLFIAGAIGFALGNGVGPAAVPSAGAPVVYYGHPGFFGFGIFGFLLFLFLIFAVIGIFRRAAWGHRGWGHHGYYGRGWDKNSWDKSSWDKSAWGDRPMPPFADEMLGRWHREAHGQPGATGQPTDPANQKSTDQPNTPA
jgi:hypothetical protein